jgi:hypothetical protein
MRKDQVNCVGKAGFGLLGLVVSAGMIWGQTAPSSPAEKPSKRDGGAPSKSVSAPTLAELLAQALKENPDIRLAETKVREAEAELNRCRIQVMQKLTALYYDIDAARKAVEEAERRWVTIDRLRKQGAISHDDVAAAQLVLMKARADLTKLEADKPFLLGKHQTVVSEVAFSPDGQILAAKEGGGPVRVWDAHTGKLVFHFNIAEGTVLDKMRKALDTPVTVSFEDKSLAEILKELQKHAPGFSFHSVLGPVSPDKANVHLEGQVPLKAALELLEDTFSSHDGTGYSRIAFALRDYGMLLTPEQQMPPGAIRLSDLDRIKLDVFKNPSPAK